MYFPIIRGRQYELQAIRECLKDDVLSEKVIPIIEPVKESRLLYEVIDLFVSKKRRISVIANPQVGSYGLQDIVLRRDLLDVESNPNDYFIYTYHAKDLDVKNFRDKSILICDNVDDFEVYEKVVRENYVNYALVADERVYRRDKFDGKVIVSDMFNKKLRNADYANVEDEPFSEDHLYFGEDGYVGFSDYSVIGKEYSETGFAPTAVAVHIVYFDDKKALRIKHFVSNSTQGIQNTPRKYGEAIQKFAGWYNDYQYRTKAADILFETFSNGRYPGLGKVKEYSLRHHFELISKYLDGEIR